MGIILVEKNCQETKCSDVISILQLLTTEGVEFSFSTTSPSVGVLVPLTDGILMQRILDLWLKPFQREKLIFDNCFNPRFVRCDFLLNQWQALTFYGNSDNDAVAGYSEKISTLPVYGYSIRFEKSKSPQWKCYYDIRAKSPAEAKLIFQDVSSKHIKIDYASVVKWQKQLGNYIMIFSQIGWMHQLVVDFPNLEVKFLISSTKLKRILPFLYEQHYNEAALLAGRMRKLGNSLGYIGCTIIAPELVHWRLYHRPIKNVLLQKQIELLL